MHRKVCSSAGWDLASPVPRPLKSSDRGALYRDLGCEPQNLARRKKCSHCPSTYGMPNGVVKEQLPNHVAIIMDGNRRWALERGWQALKGHEEGVQSLRCAIQCCHSWGIKALTVFAFSTENWERGSLEVLALMNLIERVLPAQLPELEEKGVRLRFIGSRSRLPPSLQECVRNAEESTSSCEEVLLTVALSYSGRQDITEAVRHVARQVEQGALRAEEINESDIQRHLSTSHVLDCVGPPDLLIRTSGEHRLSNFMLWELAYTELYFTPVYWPEFDEEEFKRAVLNYVSRSRRFGRRPDQF